MKNEQTKHSGILASLKTLMYQNRLGELLVSNGQITTQQLKDALRLQKETGATLGTLLKEQGIISGATLRVTLAEQFALRAVAACVALVIGFSSLGIHSARATSGLSDRLVSEKSIPEGKLEKVSLNRNAPVRPSDAYPSLFGTDETRSADISPFTKWTGIVSRLNSKTAPLPAELAQTSGESENAKLRAVNAYFNKVRYIEDKNNWGSSDYWETPAEFVSRGGDCEDFAIAKYAALKSLGFSESQMRLAIVQDTWKGIPHAILIVYTSDGAKFLDNQYKDVKEVDGFDRYRPVYSINRTGWWRHV